MFTSGTMWIEVAAKENGLGILSMGTITKVTKNFDFHKIITNFLTWNHMAK